jgi:hypothetical protein
MYYLNSITKGNKMKVEKAPYDYEHSSYAYQVVIRTDKGLVIIWFTDITDRRVDFDPDHGAMNCIFLRDAADRMITALWDTQADEFRAAFAKLTEETDNA